jgi:L-alanine-DL-glutamate epimerase-like enolase superfamily enzyme
VTAPDPIRLIRALALVVDGYELEPLVAGPERATTQIRLLGGGHDGLGEDICPAEGEHAIGPPVSPDLPLAGTWTLGSFCEHLATVKQWPEPPEWGAAIGYRNWAFESAALDLALRQDGRSLPELLDREPRPVRFVNSLGLGDPPSFQTIADRLASYPKLRFKLDVVAAWTPELMDELAATGAVEIIDFKGHYNLEVPDEAALVTMVQRVLEHFPDVLLEDPHDLPAVVELIAPHVGRVSYDAPIHEISDIGARAHAARIVNVKPCRIGGLEKVFALYAHCEHEGLTMYSGGMGELGIGRRQAQLLAAMFHPDGPNDLAPSPYNDPVLSPGLPDSPLDPSPVVGFRW